VFGRFIPPEPEKGDVNTVGGYAAVHGRPAAFEGKDGLSYSLEIEADSTGERGRPFAAYFLFVRWTQTAQPVVSGHLESGFLAFAHSASEAVQLLGRTSLKDATNMLNQLIDAEEGAGRGPPWWDAMRHEDVD
jgi:hypothetical protein